MRSIIIGALVTVAFANRGFGYRGGKWWGGAPECAQSCLSSIYDSDVSATEWPRAAQFCTADLAAPLSTCLTASCTSTLTAWTSLSSLSSSICSLYSSCTSNSDEVYTFTYPTPTGNGGYGGPWRTYTGDGTVTITGCPTDGYGLGRGFGGGYGGFIPWGAANPDDAWWGWGAGWSGLTTVTTTVTMSVSGVETTTVETFAQAVSDGVTTTTPIGDDVTGTDQEAQETGNSAVGGNGVQVVGAALAAVVAVAGML